MHSGDPVASWSQLSVVLPAASAEALGAWLFQIGAVGLETVDHETLRYRNLAATLPEAHVQIVGYFPSDQHSPDVLRDRLVDWLCAEGCDDAVSSLRGATIAAEDWAEAWREHFTIQRVSERIAIVPDWLAPPEPRPALTIRIHPGRAFGTGTHESTRLALCALDEALRARRATSLLDVGCGSAILSIAASLLGTERVVGIDNDEGVFDNASLNLAQNGVEGVELSAIPVAELDESFDLVVANIIAPVLQAIAGALVARTAAGGRLLLSGMLDVQLGETCRRFVDLGLSHQQTWSQGEWRAALLRKERRG
ncbi:MAG: 50S ribosomal protein L11 methyltransferase [Myxococcales bacterium]|nr:50S ribosomal protein L11 methyltransferase [Myxococcales bacterium]